MNRTPIANSTTQPVETPPPTPPTTTQPNYKLFSSAQSEPDSSLFANSANPLDLLKQLKKETNSKRKHESNADCKSKIEDAVNQQSRWQNFCANRRNRRKY